MHALVRSLAVLLVVGVLVVSAGVDAAPAPSAGPRPDPARAGDMPAAAIAAGPAVVGIRALVPADRPSVATLGDERQGSATLIGADGLAVTVGYLVLEAERIEARLADGRQPLARVVGHDFESGLALIQLDPASGPYPAIRVGRSVGLAPGQPVAIVGAAETGPALGRGGRVVALRSFVAPWEYRLDEAVLVAPHHPAFGGAALVDGEGALIGVVSLRLPETHLAIPIDLLAPARDALVRTGRPGRPARPWLGLRTVDLAGGVGVAGVSSTGPAHAAGLRPGDVIVRLDGERVVDVESFYQKLWSRPVGQVIELAVYREGQLESVRVRPRDRYDLYRFRAP